LRVQGLGVPAFSVTTCDDLAVQLQAALQRRGPTVIEAVL
jgi:thiamine pyrophosphate-dependent acetolactate synthase large subunit-like protein